ncbi:MAG: hypothetical protein OXU37_05115 [Thaumarchaeota archaeon]|nr:hypothetical protein [Nitrososphaerota archaeon]
MRIPTEGEDSHMDDGPAGDWEYDGHEFFTDTAWRGISISQ